MLSLVRDDVMVSRPAAPRIIPVTVRTVHGRRHRTMGEMLALRALRYGVTIGMLATAWQIGVVIGAF